MKNRIVGILAASALLLQSQAAFAACDEDNNGASKVAGTWNLVGSMFKDGGLVSYAFYCPSVVIRVGAGANKYSVTPAADCKAMSGAAQGGNTLTQGAYTVAATNSIVINPTTCKVSGSFVITHAGSSVPVTILNGRLENPIGTLPSKHGQMVAKDNLNQSVVAFTLAR